MYINVAIGVIGFVQWLCMPLLVLVAQAAAAKLVGRNLAAHVFVALLVGCAALLIPLSLFGLIPLKDAAWPWVSGAVPGGLASVPLTRFARRRYSI